MNNLKKLIFLVLAIGVFSCTEPAPPATPTAPITKIKSNPTPPPPPTPTPISVPEIGKVTMPDGTVNTPKPPTQTVPTPQPNKQLAEATLPKRKVNPMTGNLDAPDPEFEEKSAEIAAQLKSMGNVDVNDVKMIKAPPRPDVPQLNDVEKEELYNSNIQKQMGTVLKIVSQQYRIGKLSKRLTKTPSGLEYINIDREKGIVSGRQAISNSFVAFKSMGATLDGEVFETNLEKDRAYRVKLGTNALIPGLEEAVKTMRAGERAIFFIPPNLAYGNRGRIGVPPNAVVVYSLILESVN